MRVLTLGLRPRSPLIPVPSNRQDSILRSPRSPDETRQRGVDCPRDFRDSGSRTTPTLERSLWQRLQFAACRHDITGNRERQASAFGCRTASYSECDCSRPAWVARSVCPGRRPAGKYRSPAAEVAIATPASKLRTVRLSVNRVRGPHKFRDVSDKGDSRW
jgi:hypothetical protein